MSGARALASARRRRAEPPSNNVISSSSKMTNNTAPLQEEANESVKPKMSPAMMLLSHNKIIENLQTLVENLNNKIEEQDIKMKQLLEEKIGNSKVDDSNLEYYKNKIQAIDSSLEEIKKHTLKVQTFSMETNLQLVEVKKKLNKYEKKEQDHQDKQREEIIEHINKVSTILTKINYEVEQGKEAQNIKNSTLHDILQGMNNKVTSDNVVKSEVEEEEEEDAEPEMEDEEEEGEVDLEAIEEDAEPEMEEDAEPEIEGDSDNENINEDGEDTTQLNF